MGASKRHSTKYAGVFYREAERLGGAGKEKVYYVVIKRDGRIIEEKAGRQYADAMTPARAAAIRADLLEGRRELRRQRVAREEAERQEAANRWTISRLWDEYTRQRKDANKALSVDGYRFKNYLVPSFGEKQPCDILTLDVDRLRLSLAKKRSPQTVKHVLALLKRIIAFGVKKGLCQAPDPRRLHFEMPKVDNAKTDDLTPEQLARLLEAIEADPHKIAGRILLMALSTGMRHREIARLRWYDLDFARGFIRIGTENAKGGKASSIPMNDAARNLLEGVNRTASPYVFPAPGGRPYTNIYPALRRIRERAGLPKDFRPVHALRHVYASMLASSGQVDMYTLQRLLTHKSPLMTQRYSHLRDEALRRGAAVAGEILSGLNGISPRAGNNSGKR